MISPRRVSLTEGPPHRLILSMALLLRIFFAMNGIFFAAAAANLFSGLLAYGWMMRSLHREGISAHGE